MGMEIITSTTDLVPGDVLYVNKLVQPRGREEYWWRAFWIVKSVGRSYVEAMVLKMHPDPDKDHRLIDFSDPAQRQVIQYLHPHDYPQGVAAMRIKHISLGTIKLGDT